MAMHRRSQRDAGYRRARRLVAHTTSPREYSGHEFSGSASFYFEGHRVASGARFDPDGMTAAHRSLPFGTRLHVEDVMSGRSVDVTINDRGPFAHNRVLDLSRGAAHALGMTARGVTRVRARVI
jgi:rare lipoprotein A